MDAQDKVIDLEIKLGFLERTVEHLNDVLLSQNAGIEKLERRVRELEDRVANKQDAGQQEMADPLDERPPHY